MKKAKIYIDEFGNSHLDLVKAGTFSHFVYASVIIADDLESDARKARDEICKKFNLGPNIKSRNLGDSRYFEKRLKILDYLLSELDFTIDVLVIDKEKLDQESGGLRFKEVFYKYFQKLFVAKYNERFDSYEIYPDRVGEEFASELQSFVREHAIVLDLFNPNRSYKISDDVKDEKLIQLADIIAGSVGKIYCTSHRSSRMDEIFDRLHPRLSVSHFPYHTNYEIVSTEQNQEKDKLIRQLNSEILESYFEKAKVASEGLHIRLLEYLAIQNRMDPNRLVPVHELRIHLNHFSPILTDDKLRSIVRDLRYKGIFIISRSGQPGYKLASSYSDILEHYNHFMRYVIPMLEKIKAVNEKMASSSFNEMNPLEKDPSLSLLKNLIGQLKK